VFFDQQAVLMMNGTPSTGEGAITRIPNLGLYASTRAEAAIWYDNLYVRCKAVVLTTLNIHLLDQYKEADIFHTVSQSICLPLMTVSPTSSEWRKPLVSLHIIGNSLLTAATPASIC
jgi:hypothetical protein